MAQSVYISLGNYRGQGDMQQGHFTIGFLHQTHNRPCQGGFPAAAFPDQPQGALALHRQGYSIYSPDPFFLLAPQ
jgi:hypothetical protein